MVKLNGKKNFNSKIINGKKLMVKLLMVKKQFPSKL